MTKRYLLLVNEYDNDETYYGFEDTLGQLLFDYLNLDEYKFTEFLLENKSMDYNLIINFYGIKSMTLINLDEEWDDTNLYSILYHCIPKNLFNQLSDLSKLNKKEISDENNLENIKEENLNKLNIIL